MIEFEDSKTIVRFGSGHIGYATYGLPDYGEVAIGFCYQNEKGVMDKTVEEYAEAAPVTFLFYSSESIDEVIGQLLKIKNILIEMQTTMQKI